MTQKPTEFDEAVTTTVLVCVMLILAISVVAGWLWPIK